MSVLPKINEEILAEANLMDKVANDVLDPPEEEEETIVNSNEPEVLEEIPEPEEKSQDELFEKPEEKPVENWETKTETNSEAIGFLSQSQREING